MRLLGYWAAVSLLLSALALEAVPVSKNEIIKRSELPGGGFFSKLLEGFKKESSAVSHEPQIARLSGPVRPPQSAASLGDRLLNAQQAVIEAKSKLLDAGRGMSGMQ